MYSSLPLQGDSAPQSLDIVRAIDLALADAGDRAGPFLIEHRSLDDAGSAGVWDPSQVERNATIAAGDDTTIAYIGEFNSPATAFSLPILNEAGILQVSPSNTAAGLTRPDGGEPGEPDIHYPTGERTFGRVVPADHVQAGALLSAMAEERCADVLLLDDGTPYGRGIADLAERGAASAGLTVAARAAAASGTPVSQHDAGSGDCALIAGGPATGAVEIADSLDAGNPDIRLFLPDASAESAFTESIQRDLEPRVFITNPTLPVSAYPPDAATFFDAFRERYGHDPEPYAIYGYEAMRIVLDSIARAEARGTSIEERRGAVVDAFLSTRSRRSVLGTYDIDPFGDTTLRDYGVYRADAGALIFDRVIEATILEPSRGPELRPPDVSGEAEGLEGIWRGGKVRLEDLLRRFPRDEAQEVFDANGVERFMSTTLRIHGATWEALISADGGIPEGAQRGTFEVNGDRIRMRDEVGFTYVYGFELEDDTLVIRLVDSDAPAGDDVFQYAHYGAPFRRSD